MLAERVEALQNDHRKKLRETHKAILRAELALHSETQCLLCSLPSLPQLSPSQWIYRHSQLLKAFSTRPTCIQHPLSVEVFTLLTQLPNLLPSYLNCESTKLSLTRSVLLLLALQKEQLLNHNELFGLNGNEHLLRIILSFGFGTDLPSETHFSCLEGCMLREMSREVAVGFVESHPSLYSQMTFEFPMEALLNTVTPEQRNRLIPYINNAPQY